MQTTRRAWALLAASVVSASPSHAAGAEPKAAVSSMAVLPLLAKAGVDAKQTSVLDDILLSSLQQRVGKQMRVLGQSDVDRLIGFQKVKDAAGCNDVTCAVEIAGALGVDSLIYGSVGRIGKKQIISLSWIDQRDATVLGRHSESVDSEEQLIEGVGVAVARLLGVTSSASAQPVAAQPSTPPMPPSPPAPPTPPTPATPPSPAPASAAREPSAFGGPAMTPPIAERVDAGDLALNTARSGYPSPLESSPGWGGGADPWDLVDGVRTYSSWAHGLAFTGGRGSPFCGARQVTIDFGEERRFNRVILWHHGDNHVPSNGRLEYYDGGAWSPVRSMRDVNTATPLRARAPSQWWEGWSTPMDLAFAAVQGTKVRFIFDNCDIEHGWLYEVEVYNAPGR